MKKTMSNFFSSSSTVKVVRKMLGVATMLLIVMVIILGVSKEKNKEKERKAKDVAKNNELISGQEGLEQGDIEQTGMTELDYHDGSYFTKDDYIYFGKNLYNADDLNIKLDSVNLGHLYYSEIDGSKIDALKINIVVQNDSSAEYNVKADYFVINGIRVDIVNNNLDLKYNYVVDRVSHGENVVLSYTIEGKDLGLGPWDDICKYIAADSGVWTQLGVGISVDNLSDENPEVSTYTNCMLNYSMIAGDRVAKEMNVYSKPDVVLDTDDIKVSYLDYEYYTDDGYYYLTLLVENKTNQNAEIEFFDAKVDGKEYDKLRNANGRYTYASKIEDYKKESVSPETKKVCRLCIYHNDGKSDLGDISVGSIYNGKNNEIKIKPENKLIFSRVNENNSGMLCYK